MTTTETTTPVVFKTEIIAPGTRARIEISARLGTQSIGRSSGNPLDATDPGPVAVVLIGDDGSMAKLTLVDKDTVDLLADAFRSALIASQQRDRSLDLPRK